MAAMTFRGVVCVGVFGLLAGWAQAGAIVQEGFESPDVLTVWRSEGAGVAEVREIGPGGGHALRVELKARGNHLVRLGLPVEEMRGRRVAITARVKAEGVVKAKEPWHGVKIMLQCDTPGGPTYQNVPEVAGTFDWKPIGLVAEVPADATAAYLILGLGEASGVAWFDDVELEIAGTPRVRPAAPPALLPPEKLDRRTELPRLRGVMYGPQGKEEDLRVLAGWQANLIRWQFYWYDGTFPEKRGDLALYDRWLHETMAEVDRLLPVCRELGLRVVIDLHTPPGAMATGQMAMFQNKECQAKFIAVWDELARHYKDEPAIWAYDLLNEPVEGRVAEGLMDWHTLATEVARRVRAIDAKRAIIVEPGPSGGWENLAYFEPLAVPGIIYSVHMYEPLRFTHQGVMDGMPRGVTYPGMIDGQYWDRAKLKEMLEPVRAYQKDYNVPIYIGEFSAIRWAPGDSAAAYLADCISIFEEYGWDWSYHAFREWQGWNVELGTDPAETQPAATPTTRQKVLQRAFEKNARPAAKR
ncbi:hypothetical protein BH09VER1_BH09VER1_48580 [soil metagenome]